MTEWREDLKTILRRTGAEGKHLVFLFADNQVRLLSGRRWWCDCLRCDCLTVSVSVAVAVVMGQ